MPGSRDGMVRRATQATGSQRKVRVRIRLLGEFFVLSFNFVTNFWVFFALSRSDSKRIFPRQRWFLSLYNKLRITFFRGIFFVVLQKQAERMSQVMLQLWTDCVSFCNKAFVLPQRNLFVQLFFVLGRHFPILIAKTDIFVSFSHSFLFFSVSRLQSIVANSNFCTLDLFVDEL